LKSNSNGGHFHEYKDIFFSVDCTSPLFECVDVPYNMGATSVDNNNRGHQFTRTTVNSGGHDHDLIGTSLQSNANLVKTGGDQPFDNRSSFTVVQYIIYIQN